MQKGLPKKVSAKLGRTLYSKEDLFYGSMDIDRDGWQGPVQFGHFIGDTTSTNNANPSVQGDYFRGKKNNASHLWKYQAYASGHYTQRMMIDPIAESRNNSWKKPNVILLKLQWEVQTLCPRRHSRRDSEITVGQTG
ncbi:hypothetical protein EPI10_030927 [Gossypium australe]|uniref:Uncharacterized protein n=1 Tax=Gossypium australe TaxID=47621 RepID=A0A5B6X020_9ROSI|nr:hypothetical protein EPI10_030927 [Gossypium australe]